MLIFCFITESGAANARSSVLKPLLNHLSADPDTNQVKKDTKETDVLDEPVQYSARDSMRFDVQNQKVYLFGNAKVKYGEMTLEGAFMEIDMQTKVLMARQDTDSLGGVIGKPKFKEGEQSFSASWLKYNFDSKKGLISETVTQEGDGYIHGDTVKKVSEDVYYIKGGKYTTCSNPNPHFYINANKLKIIRDNKIITGPAYLKIMGIPTPLAVPFGLFPNKQGRSSGILLPGPGQSPTQGFYLNDGGYYFAINDYMALSLMGDIYSRGSWSLKSILDYRARYRFNGQLWAEFSDFKRGTGKEFQDYSNTRNFFIKWRHKQDPKARPNSSFSADVNFGTVDNFTNNITSTTNDYLTNTFKSNINYNWRIANTPFSIALTGSHTQNSKDSTMSITLPQASLTMQRKFLSDLLNISQVGKAKWWHRIGISLTSQMRNTVSGKQDSVFLFANRFENPVYIDSTGNRFERVNSQSGVKHAIPISTSMKFLKVFTFNPSINWNETWYFKHIEKEYYQLNDSTFGTNTIDVPGFSRFGQYSLNAGLTTKLYGRYSFKSRRIQAIRHVMTPMISFVYKPDFSDPKYGYYKSVQSDTSGTMSEYSIFEGYIFGGPSTSEAGLLNFSLINNLEMKTLARKDTLNKWQKIKLLEDLSARASYNLFSDSLNWSPVALSARTYLFKKINLRATATVDPYGLDSSGIRINTPQWNLNGNMGRLTNALVSIGFNYTSKKRKSESGKPKDKNGDAEREMVANNPQYYIDYNVPWHIAVNYNLKYSKAQFDATLTNTISANGDFSLTRKWKIGFNTGYDFENHDFSYTSLDLYRDLHCWEMKINIVPFGARKSYRIDINVKSPVLQDLKLSRKRDWYDLQE